MNATYYTAFQTTRLNKHDNARRYETFPAIAASRMIAKSGFPIASNGTRHRLLTDGLTFNRNLNKR